jgi:uncharacterized membrane protein YeaQ/YmgE (transglycosylase-associated protein family)
MFDAILQVATANPGLIAGAIAGGAVGIIGGRYAMGSESWGSFFASIATGIAGAVAGVFAVRTVSREVDKNTPAPMGMRVVDTPKIEDGKSGSVSVRPTVQAADKTIEALRPILQKDATMKNYAPYLTSEVFTGMSVEMKGTAASDGHSITIERAIITMPGMEKKDVPVMGLTLPLVDGKIDQNSPKSKAAIREFLEKELPKHEVPEEIRNVILENLLGRARPSREDFDAKVLAAAMKTGAQESAEILTLPYALDKSKQHSV